MARTLPSVADTVIIGNGPAALILSYILHGHIPVYDLTNPHPDPFLHRKLLGLENLLDLDVDYLTEHFCASGLSYSTQALPVNVLLDTLIRPLGETDDGDTKSCVVWRRDPQKYVPHLVLGDALRSGGQWVDNPVKASLNIGTLSYAGMLSLPGYSFDDHYVKSRGIHLPAFMRPTRNEVAEYFATYPSQVGIDDTLYCGQRITGISRITDGFRIGSHNIRCKHLVLASGIFSELIPPPSLLRPLLNLQRPICASGAAPILVIGSGFSAADVIISTSPSQKIVHHFKWDPTKSPSPLRACHQQAYPEYAGVYRRMKVAALASESNARSRLKVRRASSSTFDLDRNWDSVYEGLPNTTIVDVKVKHRSALLTLQRDGETFQREVSSLAYVVGRRGSLDYLDDDLVREVLPPQTDATLISGRTLREKVNNDLEVAKDVFVIGSLTGDSLIRFAYGSCTFAGGRILNSKDRLIPSRGGEIQTCSSKPSSPFVKAMNGLDGHNQSPILALPLDNCRTSAGG